MKTDEKTGVTAADWPTHEEVTDHLTPEQILTWLEGWREFMFEVWRKNPELRKDYLAHEAVANRH
jgi:hypothetical protein